MITTTRIPKPPERLSRGFVFCRPNLVAQLYHGTSLKGRFDIAEGLSRSARVVAS